LTDPTHMRREIEEIPAAVATLLDGQHDAFAALGAALRDRDPAVLVTIGRGSSDHAATYFKYAAERLARRPVASVGPSIASIYGIDLMLAGAAAIAISQSGKSPDLVAMMESAHRGGALGVAITNDPTSPLAAVSDHVIDIGAGVERSVAATKTFVASIVAGLAVLAHWKGDTELLRALTSLRKGLTDASNLDWSPLSDAFDRPSAYVLGRGPGVAIAAEAALKFKETSGLHAESYSTAEVLHGPSAIVRNGFPVLVFAADDPSLPSVRETAKKLADQGGSVFIAGTESPGCTGLPTVSTGHPLTDPLAQIVSFYGFVEAFSRARGHDPDRPPHLNKVTATQ